MAPCAQGVAGRELAFWHADDGLIADVVDFDCAGRFVGERDCEDQEAFDSRCLMSSVVRIEVAAYTMSLSRADRKELHMLLAEARFTAEDVLICVQQRQFTSSLMAAP